MVYVSAPEISIANGVGYTGDLPGGIDHRPGGAGNVGSLNNFRQLQSFGANAVVQVIGASAKGHTAVGIDIGNNGDQVGPALHVPIRWTIMFPARMRGKSAPHLAQAENHNTQRTQHDPE